MIEPGRQEKAWEYLTEDEQLALSLRFGHDKSTWQAGEIMGKAHYKYIEICQRGERYLKLFAEHLLLHDELIPEYLNISPEFRFYLESTIIERNTIRQVVDKMEEGNKWRIKKHREEHIIKEIIKLRKSAEAYERVFVNFLLEFDRWNNFRILPKSIQEPSAFKRRNKNNDKKNIKNVKTLNPYVVISLKERYAYHNNHPRTKYIYLPVFNDPDLEPIIKAKRTDKNIREISSIGLHVFHNEELALEYHDLLAGYDIDNNKHCTDGQRFWPHYRVLVKKSLNYHMLQKIIPSRKYFEASLRDLDLTLHNKDKKSKPKK